MNRIYKIIWSEIKSRWIVVSEKAGSRGCPILTAGALSLAVFLSSACTAMALEPGALPTGGAITSGSGTIESAGARMTVTQHTPQLIANWSSFNIGEHAGVQFVQPNATATALNRINDANPSLIMGSLNSNGRIFLLNRAGVIFGRTARVDVGGLVASSLEMLDSDFLAGRYRLANQGSEGEVLNQGSIVVRPGGVIALIGPNVANDGTISAQCGSVLMAAAGQVTLDFGGDGLVSYSVGQGAVDAQASNAGLVKADGGLVVMTAEAADALTTAVVNHTGVVEARYLQERGGRILLLSDMETGTTTVAGRLDASAPDGGDGGFVETSGSRVKVLDGTVVDTRAAAGSSGTWLIDPNDFTIAAGGDITGAALALSLSLTNVTIDTRTEGTPDGNGDLFVNEAVAWSSDKTLTLMAERNIDISASVGSSSGGGGLLLRADSDADYSGTVNVLPGGEINSSGAVSIYYNPSGGYASPTAYSNAGAAPLTAFMLVNDLGQASAGIRGLQAMSLNLTGKYALGKDIDASPTTGWNAGAGFAPIGSTSLSYFNGMFDGMGHTISNLGINRGSTSYVGLFGYVYASAVIWNVGLLQSASTVIKGSSYVGSLVGYSKGGTISNTYVSGGSVTGALLTNPPYAGGLVGYNSGGVISGSSVTGTTVTALRLGQYLTIGGLVGANDRGTLVSVSVTNATVSGTGNEVGGLVGYNMPNSIIVDAMVTGTSVTGRELVGGLAGDNLGSITRSAGGTLSVAAGTVVGASNYGKYVGGFVGNNAGGQITGGVVSNTTVINNNTAAEAPVGGFAGWNKFFLGVGTGAIVSSSVVSGTVIGNGGYVGGFVGKNDGGQISSSSVTGTNVTGAATNAGNVGGLAGANTVFTMNSANYTGTIVSSSVAGGTVTGAGQYVGGLVGMNSNSLISGSISVSGTTVTGNFNGAGYIGGLLGYNTGMLHGATATGATVAGSASTSGVGGLVGRNSGGTINSSGVLGGTVSGAQYVGGLVGDNSAGNLSNVSVSGTTVTGSSSGAGYVGGLVGYNAGTLNVASVTSANVSGSSTTDRVGGLVGRNSGLLDTGQVLGGGVSGRNEVGGLVGYQDGSVIRSYATATVTGATDVGGLVGGNFGPVSLSYAIGTVSGSTDVGGLVGLQGTSSGIVDSYATGLVMGAGNVGGLAGMVSAGTISNAYALGVVSGASSTGALIGQRAAGGVTVANSYYNSDINPGLAGVGSVSPDLTGVTGAGSAAMRSPATYSGFGFGSVWGVDSSQTSQDANINLGYPYLGAVPVQVGVYVVPSGSSVYGDPQSPPAYRYDSAANGNGTEITNASPTVGTVVWTNLPGPTTAAGNYAVAYLGGITLAAAGYSLYSGLPATWTVQQAPLGVTVTGVYSGTTTVVPTGFTVTGLKNGETIGTLASAVLHTKEVGANGSNYVTSLSIGSGTATIGNYALTMAYDATPGTTQNTATLARKTLDLEIAKTYDGSAAFEKWHTYTLSGTYHDDSVLLGSGTASVSSKDAGSYASFVSGAFVLDNDNYTLVGGGVSAMIDKATLTVRPESKSRLYGESNPVFTQSITGYVSGEDATSAGVTGVAEGSSAATASSAVGSHLISGSAGTLSAGNYVFTAADLAGGLTIIPAPLGVTVTGAYSGTTTVVPTGFTVTGLKNGETIGTLASAVLHTKEVSANGSNYVTSLSIGSGTATIGNYALTMAYDATPGTTQNTATIDKATLTVRPESKSRLYGESNPVFTQSITGYVSGEDATSAGVAGVAEGSSAATASSAVGSYLISGSAGTLSAGNYDFTAVDLPGGLSIDPTPLTITPADVTKPFGIAVELREYTLTGLRNGETVGSVTLGSAGADASAPVEGSPYDIVAANAAGGSFDAGNYRIVYNTGLLTVLPIPNPVRDDPPVDSSMLVALARNFVPPGDDYGLGTHGLVSVDLLVPATADSQGTIVVTLPGSQLLHDASFRFSLPQEVSESLQAGSETVTLSDGRPLPGWLAYRQPGKVFEGWNVHREALPLSVTISSDERSWQVIITEEKLHGLM